MTGEVPALVHSVELFNEALASLDQPPLEDNRAFRKRTDGLPGHLTFEVSDRCAPLRFTFGDFALQIDLNPFGEVAVVPAERFDDEQTGIVATVRLFLHSKVRVEFSWGGRRARVLTIDDEGRITSEYRALSIGGRYAHEEDVVEYDAVF